MRDEPIAAFISDVHLMHNPPPARAKEPSWYAAMQRVLDQVRMIIGRCPGCGGAGKVLAEGKCGQCDGVYRREIPLFVAGDIFHRWQSVPELINFAIKHFPTCHAIPGQHDLPYHNYENRHKSAYWTLVEAGVIKEILPGEPYKIFITEKNIPNFYVWGFPWEVPIVPPPPQAAGKKAAKHIALVHAYIWAKGYGYPGAPATSRLGTFKGALEGYAAAFFGDNHIHFEGTAGTCQVYNCGSLMRLNSDQAAHRPAVALLTAAGRIVQVHLGVGADVFEQTAQALDIKLGPEMHEFVRELDSLSEVDLSYTETLRRATATEGVSAGAAKVLLQVLDGK